MNQSFSDYFRETFFQKEVDFDQFVGCLTKPIKRSIRVNTQKISIKELKSRLEKQGYILTPTFNPTVFYIERGEDFIPMDTRLGYSIEHLTGLFYIQELGASSSVHYLTDGKIHDNPYLILDLASSPGGKTTQLAEHYPNAFIVANDASNDRIAQLISNVERMGSSTIGITHYPGSYYGRFAETFDRVLLDAPCSGE
jgi:16S rRNA (cytosine1407-C5)-methyltransferase